MKNLILISGFLFFLLPGHYVSAATNQGYDFPAGIPDGKGYTNGNSTGDSDGWGFLEWNGTTWHPGEDWNRGGGDLDFGDPLFSMGKGVVKKANDYKRSWGKIILVEYDFTDIKIWAQYAHLSEISVREGDIVNRGQFIGKIGDGNGNWVSHLHFEIRKINLVADYWPGGLTENQIKEKYYGPSEFISAHRPVIGQSLTITTAPGQATITWDKNESPDFDRYELYRSETASGTDDPSKRTIIFTIKDPSVTTYTDKNLLAKTYYYKLATFYKDGRVGFSGENEILVKRNIFAVSPGTDMQQGPVISDGRVFWRTGSNNLTGLYYYDINAGKTESISTKNCGYLVPYFSVANANLVAFSGYTGYGYDVCYIDMDKMNPTPVSVSPIPLDQVPVGITANKLIIWSHLQEQKIYYLDITKSIGPQLLVNAGGIQIRPKVTGTKVFWKDSRNYIDNSKFDLYMKDISDPSGPEIKLISNFVADEYTIWGNYIAYRKNYTTPLILKNYVTGADVSIEPNNAYPGPMDGEKLAYSRYDGTNSYIYIYDLNTGEKTKIDFPISISPMISMKDGWLAFDARSGLNSYDLDIYLTKL